MLVKALINRLLLRVNGEKSDYLLFHGLNKIINNPMSEFSKSVSYHTSDMVIALLFCSSLNLCNFSMAVPLSLWCTLPLHIFFPPSILKLFTFFAQLQRENNSESNNMLPLKSYGDFWVCKAKGQAVSHIIENG